MDPALAQIRRARAVKLLVPLFLFSGATSLVYETLWERQLHLIVGTSQVAVITVLAAFMTGLALGGFAASRVADRVRKPLQAYAILEGTIGVYAVVFPWVVQVLEPIYLNFWRSTQPDPTTFAAFQFVLLGVFLLPPTMCMGATLPLLARFATTTADEAGAQIGRLYGANTLGAVLGVALAGFVLLPGFGLAQTTWITAAGNVALCLAAFALGRSAGALPSLGAEPAGVVSAENQEAQAPAEEMNLWEEAASALQEDRTPASDAAGAGEAESGEADAAEELEAFTDDEEDATVVMGIEEALALRVSKETSEDDAAVETAPSDAPSAPASTADPAAPAWLWVTALVGFLAGLASLLYEVSWFRLMVLTLGGSAYAFSIMLLAFLLGIGLGGWAGGPLSDRALKKGGLPGALRLVAGLQLAAAATAWAMMFTYNELPFFFVQVYTFVENTPEFLWPAKLFIAVLVMLPPALFMGASFPCLVRTAALSTELGRPVGRIRLEHRWLGAWCLLGGLVLFPSYQVQGTVVVAVSINLLAAVAAARAAAWARGDARLLPLTGAWVVAATVVIGLLHWKKPPWNPLLMTAGMYKYVSDLDPESRTREGIYEFAVEPYDLVFYEEGLSSVVTVAAAKDSGNIWLANNGKVDASTVVDMPTQVMCAHLAFLFRQDAEEVLLIGLASGITAGSITKHDNLTSIEVIELEPAIVEASHFFDEHNSRPLDDERVVLIENDGRNFLNLQPDGTYDVIVSEPSNPWLSGVSNLFTKEFFALGKSKLSEGGVWSQWVQMYGMDERDLKALLRTFAETYAHVRLFSTIEDADLVLIGSDSPLTLDANVAARLMAGQPAVREEMSVVDIDHPEDILTLYQVDRQGILQFAQDAPLNTDDNMLIEYSAPLHLHEDTATGNFQSLLSGTDNRDEVPIEMVVGVEGRIDLARAYARRGNFIKALVVLKEAEKEEPGNPYVFELYDRYQRALQAELNDEPLPPDAQLDVDPRGLLGGGDTGTPEEDDAERVPSPFGE